MFGEYKDLIPSLISGAKVDFVPISGLSLAENKRVFASDLARSFINFYYCDYSFEERQPYFRRSYDLILENWDVHGFSMNAHFKELLNSRTFEESAYHSFFSSVDLSWGESLFQFGSTFYTNHPYVSAFALIGTFALGYGLYAGSGSSSPDPSKYRRRRTRDTSEDASVDLIRSNASPNVSSANNLSAPSQSSALSSPPQDDQVTTTADSASSTPSTGLSLRDVVEKANNDPEVFSQAKQMVDQLELLLDLPTARASDIVGYFELQIVIAGRGTTERILYYMKDFNSILANQIYSNSIQEDSTIKQIIATYRMSEPALVAMNMSEEVIRKVQVTTVEHIYTRIMYNVALVDGEIDLPQYAFVKERAAEIEAMTHELVLPNIPKPEKYLGELIPDAYSKEYESTLDSIQAELAQHPNLTGSLPQELAFMYDARLSARVGQSTLDQKMKEATQLKSYLHSNMDSIASNPTLSQKIESLKLGRESAAKDYGEYINAPNDVLMSLHLKLTDILDCLIDLSLI